MRSSTALAQDPIGPASDRFAEVVERLESRIGEVVDDILDAMHALPEYAAVDDPVIWDEIRQHTTGSVRLTWSALRGGRLPRESEMKTALFFAQRRAEQGVVSLRALHSAYVTGMRILWEALIHEAGEAPELRAEILDRSSWAFQYLDFLTSAVADAYHEAQKGRSRRHDQRTRDLFDEIIDGDPDDVAGLERRARLAGLEVRAELRAVVVRGSSDGAGDAAIGELAPVPLLIACAESAGLPVERVAAARRGSELLLIFPWRGAELARLRDRLGDALRRLLGASTASRAGVSGRALGAAELRRAYRECVRAQDLGAIVSPASPVHCYDDYVLDDVFDSAASQGERLIAQTLGPLLELGDAGERLVQTLDAYFRAGFNHKATAAAVDIHRNTLAHRLEQIRRVTGLDLEDPTERLRVETALRFLELRRLRSASAT